MKKYVKILFSLIIGILIIGVMSISNAFTANEDNFTDFLKNNTSIDYENLKESDSITLIEELTNKYSTDELADIIDQYSDELKKNGMEEENINSLTTFLRSTDSKSLREFMNDIDLNAIKARLDNGEKTDDIIEDLIASTPTDQLASMAGKFLLTNKAFRSALIKSAIVSFIIGIYMIVVRWIIYKKAGKHGWAAIIPIYKDVVWLQIAGLSPWLLLLFLIPILGWIALAIIFIVAKFKIPVQFGRSAIWGLGLWFIPIIFESVIAFSKEFQYHKDEKKEEAQPIENV